MFAASSKKVFLKDKMSCINKRRTSQLSALNFQLSLSPFGKAGIYLCYTCCLGYVLLLLIMRIYCHRSSDKTMTVGVKKLSSEAPLVYRRCKPSY